MSSGTTPHVRKYLIYLTYICIYILYIDVCVCVCIHIFFYVIKNGIQNIPLVNMFLDNIFTYKACNKSHTKALKK